MPAICQDASIMSSLRSKYTSVQYHPECGGWYFLSYQKDNNTLYGLADNKGNVIVSEATKYKLHKGYGEFYLLDQEKKQLHDQWIIDKRQYEIDLQNYNRVKTKYEGELSAYREKVRVAKDEANRRYENAKQLAIQKAQAEYEAKQRQMQSSGGNSILGAVLGSIAGGFSVAAAASSVKYEPFEQQVLAERSLTVGPSEPYNPKPTLPAEPSDGYYWKKANYMQPDKYSYIDYDKISESEGFADVMCDGKYGLIDVYFNEVVPCRNSTKVLKSTYDQDKYIINDGGYGVINAKAKTIVPCEYSNITVDGNRLIVKKNGKTGLLSLTGKEIMPCDFDELQSSNGFYLCKKNNLWGVYTSDFQELYPCQFQKVNFARINKKLVLHTQNRGLWGVVDFESGDNLLPNNYASITETTLGGTSFFQTQDQEGNLGLYNASGIVVLPSQFKKIRTVDIANASYIETTDKASTIGLYGLTGIPYIPTGKYNSYIYRGTYFEVANSSGKGICSIYGEEMIPCKYSDLTYFAGNKFFIAKRSGKLGAITLYGKEMFPMVTANDYEYSEYNNYIVIKDGYKAYGAIDFAGNEIVPRKQKDSYAVFKKVSKYEKKVNIHKTKVEAMQLASSDDNVFKSSLAEESAKRSKFSFFAQNYVERVINDWQKRGEFEKESNWKLRVNSDTRQQKVYSLTKEAQTAYVKESQSQLKADNPYIVGSYDPDHETYRIKSSYSDEDLLVNVSTDDAQEFKASFSSLRKTPSFFVENDKLGLAEYSFTMSNGHTYKYSNQSSLVYTVANVDYSFDAIEIDGSASNMNHQRGKQTISTVNMTYGRSDVDVNIPQTEIVQEDVYAIIISNENYENEKKVEFAYNDGQTIKDYFTKSLGLPEKNVHLRPNASLNNMRFEINWMKQMAQETGGKAKFILYYAGHGMPGDNQEDACLLPIDGTSSDFNSGYKLSELYETLSEMPSENIIVLLDACFSGASRSGEVMASTRGVALKTKIEAPKGNVVVFSATRDNETAHPYREKNHGLFTYFLLKNMQSTQGTIDFGTLSDNVSRSVAQTALKEVNKPQHPTVTSSSSMQTSWRKLQLK